MSTYSENATHLTTIKVYLPFLTVRRASVVCRSNACLHLHPRLRISNSQNLHTVPGGNWVSAPQHFQNFGPDLAKHLCVWGTSDWKRSHRLHWMLLETKSHSSTLCGARCLMLRGGASQGPSRLTTRLSSNCQSVKMKKKKQKKQKAGILFIHPSARLFQVRSAQPALFASGTEPGLSPGLCHLHQPPAAGSPPAPLPSSPAARRPRHLPGTARQSEPRTAPAALGRGPPPHSPSGRQRRPEPSRLR